MDIAILITELLTPVLRNLPAAAVFLIFASILVYILKYMKEQTKQSDEQYQSLKKGLDDLKRENHTEFQAIRKELDYIKNVALEELKTEQLDNRKLTLRTLITNAALPTEYRLRSYDEYVGYGGNSWITEYKNKYLKLDDQEDEG